MLTMTLIKSQKKIVTVYLLSGVLIVVSGVYAMGRMPVAHPGVAPRDGIEPS